MTHFTLLRLPYYWDEAGYYIPAAWDFFRTGSLIPTTTLSNAHPPLPSIYLALWWKLSGYFPEVTREAVLMVASLGLLAVWRLAQRVAGSAMVAFWTVVLTAIYPIWFAQSTLAQADIFAAACTLWGLVYALPDRERKPWAAALWFIGGRVVQGDGDCRSADTGRGVCCGGFSRRQAFAVSPVAGERVAGKLRCAAGGLVCLALCEDGVFLRQSGIFALQRGSHDDAVADSGGIRLSGSAPDRAHEYVCAGADDVCGADAEPAAGRGGA